MKNYTDINILLDRSGSMQSIKNDTIGGFNNFLKSQKRDNPTAIVTLAQFNYYYELVKSAQRVSEIEELTENSYNPDGGTALLDNLTRLVHETGHRLCQLREEDRPSKVIVVIMTDGEENASTRYTLEEVKSMIRHQEDKYSWEFVYIGANQDAIKAGTSMGVKIGSSINYNATSRGVQHTFEKLSGKMSECATLEGNNKVWQNYQANGLFTEEEKADIQSVS